MQWRLGSVVLILCLGCGSHLTLVPDAAPQVPSAAPMPLPLVIELVELRQGGFPQGVDESFANRVAMDFRQSGGFPGVLEPIDGHRAPRDAVRAQVVLESVENAHTVTNGAKAFLTGLSLFLLGPVFRYDFDAEMNAEALLRTCDGWTKRFTSQARGSLRSALFAAEERSEMALRLGVLERALAPLVAEIARDAELRRRASAIEASSPRPMACAR